MVADTLLGNNVMTENLTATHSWQIAPLVWKREFRDWRQVWTADVGFGTFEVVRWKDNETSKWGPWKWGYCFREYHDELTADCGTPAEGKRKAWEEWLRRIVPALKQVSP